MKRLVSMVLILALLATSVGFLPESAYAADSNKKVSGDCYYASELYGSKDFSLHYYYEDSYFSGSAYNVNKSLATMSMIVTMAGGRSNRAKSWSDKSQNLKALWSDLGFGNISVNKAYTIKPINGDCGIACASKTLTMNGKKYTLLAMNINGFRLFDEWGSAAECGRNGDHEAAVAMLEKADSFLKKYISNKGISGNVKLWLTGYGVGAAVADLLAAEIDDGASIGSGVTLKKEDFYAYLFNCPRIALSSNGLQDSVYNNIKVYNYPYNYITYLALANYGFGRYGELHEYPTKNGTSNYSNKLSEMKKMLKSINGSPESFTLDNFHMKKAILSDPYITDSNETDDLAEFLGFGVRELGEVCAPTRATWVSEFQSDCSLLISYMLGGLDENWIMAIDYFMENVNKDVFSIAMYVVLGMESSLKNLYISELRDAMKKAGVVDYDDAMLQKYAAVLAKTIVKIGKKGTKYLDHGATFIGNMKTILIEGLDPTLQLAWLMTEDPYFRNPNSFQSSSGDDVSAKIELSECSIKLSKTSYVYNGKAKKPTVTVTYDGKKLVKDEDYTLTYKSNKNAGTAKVVVKGKGEYTGSVTKKFTIKKAGSEVIAKNITKTYNTSKKTYTIDYEYTGDGDLSFSSSSSKIKVSSSGKVTVPAKYIGKATITITHEATTNYKSSSTKITVSIKPTKTEIESLSNSSSKRLTIKWKKNSTASKYEIQCATTSDFSSYKSYTTKGDNTSFNVNKIPVGTKVYVRMRTVKTINDKDYKSSWSSKKSIKIKK